MLTEMRYNRPNNNSGDSRYQEVSAIDIKEKDVVKINGYAVKISHV